MRPGDVANRCKSGIHPVVGGIWPKPNTTQNHVLQMRQVDGEKETYGSVITIAGYVV